MAGEAATGPLEVRTPRDGDECGLEVVEGETWVLQLQESNRGPSVSLCAASARFEGPDDPWLATLREAAAAR